MFFLSLLFCQLFSAAIVHAAYGVLSITCICSTTHCLEHQMFRCNTTGVCFSQYLDRRDGSHPVVRGCISSKTPLLCENRRPAIAGGSWPILLCCDNNLCNRDVVPTPPPWFVKGRDNSDDAENSLGLSAEGRQTDQEQLELGGLPLSKSMKEDIADGSSELPDNDEEGSVPDDPEDTRRNGFPKIVSPVYISVLVLGIISLVVVGIVATVVLRRNNKFYAEQYGALERHEAFLKQPFEVAHLQGAECDSVQTLSSCDHRLSTFPLCPCEDQNTKGV